VLEVWVVPTYPAHVMAGWASATKNRLGGSRIAGIVAAWHATDSRCVTCLTPTVYDGKRGDAPTFGHLVPASVLTPGAPAGLRGGYVPENGALMCWDCQHALGDTPVTVCHFQPVYYGSTFPRTVRVARVDSNETKATARGVLGYA